MQQTEVGFVQKTSLAEEVGIKMGDKITSINDKKVSTWQEMLEQLAIKDFGGSRKVEVNRDGKQIVLFIDGDQLIKAVSGQKPLGLAPFNAFVYLNSVETLKPAGRAGLKDGDTIITVNNESIKTISQLISLIGSNKEKPITITYKRKIDTLTVTVTPDAQGLIGVGISEYFYGPIYPQNL